MPHIMVSSCYDSLKGSEASYVPATMTIYKEVISPVKTNVLPLSLLHYQEIRKNPSSTICKIRIAIGQSTFMALTPIRNSATCPSWLQMTPLLLAKIESCFLHGCNMQ